MQLEEGFHGQRDGKTRVVSSNQFPPEQTRREGIYREDRLDIGLRGTFVYPADCSVYIR